MRSCLYSTKGLVIVVMVVVVVIIIVVVVAGAEVVLVVVGIMGMGANGKMKECLVNVM